MNTNGNANANANVNANVARAAQQFAENLAKYPDEEQLAVIAISQNVLNGCPWEFIRSDPKYAKAKSAFDKNPNVSLQEVTYDHNLKKGGYLVYMDMGYLCNLLVREAPGLIDSKDLDKAKLHREEAAKGLIEKMKAGYRGIIGIYCTNDSQTITVSGKTYPAYALTLREMLQVAEKLNYGIVFGQAVRSPQSAMQKEDALLKALTVAPSSNAMFINIAPMR